MRPAKKIVRSVVLHAGVTVGGVTETGATGMAAMLPKLRAMAKWHLLLKHANANPNLSAMQHQFQS
jgi:hypothetical protein